MFSDMKRREFLKGSAMGMSALAAGLSGSAPAAATGGEAGAYSAESSGEKIGRPVRVVSLGFHAGEHPLEWVATQVDAEGALGTDIIALPETFRGNAKDSAEPLDGPTVTAMSRLARKHRT